MRSACCSLLSLGIGLGGGGRWVSTISKIIKIKSWMPSCWTQSGCLSVLSFSLSHPLSSPKLKNRCRGGYSEKHNFLAHILFPPEASLFTNSSSPWVRQSKSDWRISPQLHSFRLSESYYDCSAFSRVTILGHRVIQSIEVVSRWNTILQLERRATWRSYWLSFWLYPPHHSNLSMLVEMILMAHRFHRYSLHSISFNQIAYLRLQHLQSVCLQSLRYRRQSQPRLLVVHH